MPWLNGEVIRSIALAGKATGKATITVTAGRRTVATFKLGPGLATKVATAAVPAGPLTLTITASTGAVSISGVATAPEALR